MKKYLKNIIAAILCTVTAVCCLTGCDKNETKNNKRTGDGTMVIDGIDFGIEGNEGTISGFDSKYPLAAIYVEGYGVIVMELYTDIAPNTVNNFISLIKKGYYDGIIFHRVIENFMIQTGDPKGTGTGGPGYTIKGEFTVNGFKNSLSHERGVVSMARTAQSFNSAGSQFFIMHVDYPYLDGQYASFGKVISGIEVVDKIATTKTDSNDKPKSTIAMTKVIVDTKGVDYPEPEHYGVKN